MRLFSAPPSQSKIRRRRSPARHRRLNVEPLEQRALLAANLQITSVVLVDASNNLMTAPVIGQMVFLRAAWRTTDLTTADQYVVRFSVDGVPLDSGNITGAAGVNLGWTWYRGGWYAAPGLHNVSVTVDGAGAVAETMEADNTFATSFTPITPTDLPSKFIWPLPSQQSKDWVIVNYNDVNPLTTSYSDYRGGPYAYDGHNAFDITLSDFRDMDLGEPIYAAASGTVVSTQDGLFDRQTVWNGQDANYIVIDHGNSWQTFYWHLARYTMTVAPGDAVQAGQLIGFVGSSGISTAQHVHFGAKYRGAVVETAFAPETYFFNPPAYQREAPILSMGSGISNYDFVAAGDLGERASTINVFPNTYSGRVYFYYRVSQLRVGDTWSVTWYRPNGTVESNSSGTYTSEGRRPSYYWFLSRPWGSNPGNWQVAYTVNGVELARENFYIVDPASVSSEMSVRQAGAMTLDERTTPYDFGTVAQAAAAPQQSWTIENHGYAALSIPAISVPPGFSIVSTAPTSIPVGGNAILTLQMSTATPGYRFGAVNLTTNDPSESTFSFNVEGTVTGTPATGSPAIATTSRQTRYHAGNAPTIADPLVTVSDPNTTVWTGGSLNVRFASNLNAGDELWVRNQGTGAGQIGLVGADISYQGITIGTLGGSLSDLIVTFNNAATTAAIQALARNITYANSLAAPAVAARYLAFTLTDETLLSATAYKTITSVNDPATITNIPDQVIMADTSTGPLAFTLGSPDKARTNLSVSATSNNPTLIPAGGLLLGGSVANRTLNITPAAAQTGSATVTVTVIDVNGGTSARSFVVTVTPAIFQATQVLPTNTGVVVSFNRDLNPADLNIVDANPSQLGPSDVTLVLDGATTVRGSVTVSPDRRSIAFVAFGGALPNGSYALSLRSAVNGFKDIGGNLLDGNSNGTPGDDLTFNFVVASTDRQVAIPSFARGPQQSVDLPTTSTGLPLTISDGSGITQIGVTLFFDPTLLTVSGATLPAGLPAGASLNTDTTQVGRIIVTLTSPTPLNAGTVNWANLTATVPGNAPYTGKNLLDLTNVQVNGGTIPARDVDAVHVVAYFGDVNANGAYGSSDAAALSRVAIGLESGFTSYQLLDPRIIGDLNGNSAMTSQDASRALQLAVGLVVANVPLVPAGVTVTVSGPDPRLWIPTDLVARQGQTIRIPLNLDSVIDLTGQGVAAADLVLKFDPAVFEIVSIDRGELVANTASWLLSQRIDNLAGELQLGMAAPQDALEGQFSGTLAWLNVRVRDQAPVGVAAINLLNQGSNGHQTLLNDGQLTLIPAISNDAFDPGVDGVVTILPPETMDVSGDGRVSNFDALLIINRIQGTHWAATAGDVNGDGKLTAFDALRIINSVDEFHRRTVPASLILDKGGGEAGTFLHDGGAENHQHELEGLPFMSAEQANFAGGLEPLIHLLALEAGRGNRVRISTARQFG